MSGTGDWFLESNGFSVGPYRGRSLHRRETAYVPWESVFEPSGRYAHVPTRAHSEPRPPTLRQGRLPSHPALHNEWESRRPSGWPRYGTISLSVRGCSEPDRGNHSWFDRRYQDSIQRPADRSFWTPPNQELSPYQRWEAGTWPPRARRSSRP